MVREVEETLIDLVSMRGECGRGKICVYKARSYKYKDSVQLVYTFMYEGSTK